MNRERWIIAHAAATWYMTGVIWMVQWVHYPLFAKVGDNAFVAYQHAHTSGMTPVVLPAMFVELIAAALLASGASRCIAEHSRRSVSRLFWPFGVRPSSCRFRCTRGC